MIHANTGSTNFLIFILSLSPGLTVSPDPAMSSELTISSDPAISSELSISSDPAISPNRAISSYLLI